MTITVATLLDRAVRGLGELQANQTLDSDTLTMLGAHTLEWLNGLCAHVTGTGEVLFNKSVEADETLAAGNVRLSCALSCTVTLPAAPQDGWRIAVAHVATGQTLTLAGAGAKINGAASDATVAAAAVDEFLFRADLNDWIDHRVSATGDAVPWPDDLLGGLAAMLAIELQPMLGLPLKFDTRAKAAACEVAMVKRYFRKHPALFTGFRYQASPQSAAPGA